MNVRLQKLMWFAAVSLGPASLGIACGGSSSVELGVGDGGAGDGSSTDGTTPGNDGAIATDGSGATTQDGGTPSDAGPGGSLTSLTCGTTSCAIPSDRCCVYPAPNPPPDFSYLCATGSGCPDAGGRGNAPTELTCSGAANCGVGTVCCIVDTNGLISSACRAACNPTGGNAAQLCDPAVTPTGCSADAGTCSNKNIGDWGLTTSYGTCGGIGH